MNKKTLFNICTISKPATQYSSNFPIHRYILYMGPEVFMVAWEESMVRIICSSSASQR